MTDSVAEKVRSYENFLNDKLRVDLRRLLEQRDVLYNEVAEYNKLSTFITTIQDAKQRGAVKKELEMQVDLGCNFFCEAVVPDASRLMMHIGFGFHLELELGEAQDVITKRVAWLEKRGEHLSKQVSEVKALIHMVLEGLRELQQLSAEPTASETDDGRSF